MSEKDNLNTLLQQMIDKAARSLAAAKYGIEAGDCDFASLSRITF